MYRKGFRQCTEKDLDSVHGRMYTVYREWFRQYTEKDFDSVQRRV